MMLRLDNVSLAFGARPLLDRVSLHVDAGERVCLVGRNGEGKSSLLRLVGGAIQPDSGAVWVQPGARVAHLAQDITALNRERVIEVVEAGLPEVGAALAEYSRLSHALEHGLTARATNRMAELQAIIDARDGWRLQQRVAEVLTRLQLDGEAVFAELSGGWRRRALLAQALVSDPELLLLDEPTNHLDIGAIEWLEQALLEYHGALLFVSHDRAFVNRLATRVVELDRGAVFSTAGNYETYQQKKSQLLAAEAQQRALFDKQLAQEEVWIRKGVEARRTRNEGRVRALYALREQHRQRRERTGSIVLEQQAASESAQLVCEAEGVSAGYGERVVIREFNARIMRGDRIGIVGPNGAGKSTLLKLLLGELEPLAGRLRRGGRLEVAYFDQQREQLKLDESVMDNVIDRNEHVTVNGKSRHVSSYLRDFLFRPEQMRTPARALSGGERNRLLLARLFTRAANLLVLDEPTNDLDMDTLELLEEYVSEFSGTLLLVSHDRAFLDNVVTDLLVLDGSGSVQDFVGGYSDWARYRAGRAERAQALPATPKTAAADAVSRTAAAAMGGVAAKAMARKLPYKDQRELDRLPARIEALEAQKAALDALIADPAFYARPHMEVRDQLAALAALSAEIDQAYARWSALGA
jgi:ATP-binding cassette subfamily F protein uup